MRWTTIFSARFFAARRHDLVKAALG